jgi:hypothetical protein
MPTALPVKPFGLQNKKQRMRVYRMEKTEKTVFT